MKSFISKLTGQRVMTLGVIAIAIGFIIKQLISSENIPSAEFINGFCFGLGLTLVIAGVIKSLMERNNKNND